jgi:hypothetical protein
LEYNTEKGLYELKALLAAGSRTIFCVQAPAS